MIMGILCGKSENSSAIEFSEVENQARCRRASLSGPCMSRTCTLMVKKSPPRPRGSRLGRGPPLVSIADTVSLHLPCGAARPSKAWPPDRPWRRRLYTGGRQCRPGGVARPGRLQVDPARTVFFFGEIMAWQMK